MMASHRHWAPLAEVFHLLSAGSKPPFLLLAGSLCLRYPFDNEARVSATSPDNSVIGYETE